MAQADTSSTWALNMVDGTSQAAETATEALGKLKRQIDADKRALTEMQAAMRNLQAGSVVNVAQFRELQARISEKREAVARAQSAYLELGGTFGSMRRRTRPSVDAFAELQKQISGVGGPIANVTGRLTALRGLLAGGAIALGVIAIGTALTVMAAAAVAATAALLKYGIAAANATRAERLRLEGLTKMRSWWGIPAGSATEMQAAIDKVSASTAIGRDKVAEYTAELYRMGLRGENLTLALEGTAIKAAVLGDAAGRSFAQWAAGAALAGGSVRRLADDVKARFGGIAAAQMLDLNVQMAKMRENFAGLFSGLKIEGLLEALRRITSLLDASTASGAALRAVLETFLQPMIYAIEAAAPIARRFFQGITIGALMTAIAVLQVRNWLRRTFGDRSIFAEWDAQTTALKLGLAVFGAMIGVLGALSLTFTAVGVAVALATAPIWLPIVAFIALRAAAERVYTYLSELDWKEIASSLVSGLVNGIRDYGGRAVDAIRNLGADMWAAFREKLGIASPSKVFEELGRAIPQGVESGVERGTPGARTAVGEMMDADAWSDPYAAPKAPRAASARSAESRALTVTIGDVYVNSQGQNAAQIAADIRPELVRLLEGVLIELGGNLAGT